MSRRQGEDSSLSTDPVACLALSGSGYVGAAAVRTRSVCSWGFTGSCGGTEGTGAEVIACPEVPD